MAPGTAQTDTPLENPKAVITAATMNVPLGSRICNFKPRMVYWALVSILHESTKWSWHPKHSRITQSVANLILASKFGGTKIRSITCWKRSLLILKDSKPTTSNNKGIIRRKKKRYQVEYQASKLVVLWNERMEQNLIPNQIAPTSCTSSTTTVVLAGHQS